MAQLVEHALGMVIFIAIIACILYTIYNQYREKASHIAKMVTTNTVLANIASEIGNNKMYWEIISDYLMTLENNHKNNAYMSVGDIAALVRDYITNHQKLSPEGITELTDLVKLLERDIVAELVKSRIQTGTPIYVGLLSKAIDIAVGHTPDVK